MSTVLETSQVAPVAIPHDFPFPICTTCGFPIPARDLGGSEFLPCHVSTCQPQPLSTEHQEASR